MAEAGTYLEEHNVERAIAAAIDQILATRPADPVRALAEIFNPDLAAEDGYAIKTGSYHQHIQTSSAEAQRWFDRGIVWTYAFHREEAEWCFEKAIAADASCAMAYWGLALVHGPNYNFSEKAGFYAVAAQPEGHPSLNVAVKAIRVALELTADKSSYPPRERALIEALATRYEYPPSPTTPNLQNQYAIAMGAVHKRFPEDVDICAVYAEAVMCLHPWNLYEKVDGADTPVWYSADKKLGPAGQLAKRVLDRGLAIDPGHVWCCHLKIHLCEMGPVDDFDWRAAEVVRNCDATGAGHLVHMPTHLDIQVGNYAEAMRCNTIGYKADLVLHARHPERFGIYVGYVVHNLEFCVWAAMYAGCYKVASEAAAALDGFFDEKLLRSNPALPTYFEAYSAVSLMVLVRFGKWAEILAMPLPDDPSLYVGRTLFAHFARGLAYGVETETLPQARQEQQAFLGGMRLLSKGDRLHHNVDLVQMVAIAERVLEGELLYRAAEAAKLPAEQIASLKDERASGYTPTELRQAGYAAREFWAAEIPLAEARGAGFPEDELAKAGYLGSQHADAPSHDDAFAALDAAIALFDALPYDEPHGWLMSVRQTLGALLTEQGRWEKAIYAYEEDLALFPNNPWALAGLKRCLRKSGESYDCSLSLAEVEARLATALKTADLPIDVSCACARRGSD